MMMTIMKMIIINDDDSDCDDNNIIALKCIVLTKLLVQTLVLVLIND
jgi:hypothetical protein